MLSATITAYNNGRTTFNYALGGLYQLLARRTSQRNAPAQIPSDSDIPMLRLSAQSLRDICRSRDELGVIVRAHIHLDHLLFVYVNIKAPKKYNANRVRPDYWKLVTIAVSRGLPKELEAPLRKLGFIRNEFAHKFGRTLTAADISDVWGKLPSPMQQSLKSTCLAKQSVGVRDQLALTQYQKIVAAMDTTLRASIKSAREPV